jgi:uncharacterized protein (TIGR02217 family)
MSTTVLPSLPGLTYPLKRKTMFSNQTQENVSGKEVRIAYWSTPRYSWNLNYSALRQGQLVGTWAEYAQLESFFENMLGGFDSFLYTDADDYQAVNQTLGISDGVLLDYPLVRKFGTALAPVLAPNLDQTFTLYLNGTAADSSGYLVTPWGTSTGTGPGHLLLSAAPTDGVVLSASFQYYFPVRWNDDAMDFEKFLVNCYGLQDVSFTSIK